MRAADVGPIYAGELALSVRCRTDDEDIFVGQVRLWRVLNPKATSVQFSAAVGRILDELEGRG